MFGASSRLVLGLDVGTYSVKAILLEHLKQGYKVIRSGYKLVNRNLGQYDPSKFNVPDTVAAIGSLMSEMKIKPAKMKALVSSIGGTATSLKEIRSIQMTDEELATSLQFEARKHLPLDDSDSLIDYQVLGEDPSDPEKLRILLVATTRKMYATHEDILLQSGFKPGMVDLEQLAIVNTYFGLEGYPEEGVVMFLNIGARMTSVVIDGRKDRIFARDIPIAGHRFTNEIASKYDLEYGAAEEKKFSEGVDAILGQKATDAGALSIQETTSLDELLGEINRTIRYYIKETGQNNFAAVVMMGGSAQMKGLEEYLAGKLDVTIEKYNPFPALHGDIPQDYLCQHGISVGLALRREE